MGFCIEVDQFKFSISNDLAKKCANFIHCYEIFSSHLQDLIEHYIQLSNAADSPLLGDKEREIFKKACFKTKSDIYENFLPSLLVLSVDENFSKSRLDDDEEYLIDWENSVRIIKENYKDDPISNYEKSLEDLKWVIDNFTLSLFGIHSNCPTQFTERLLKDFISSLLFSEKNESNKNKLLKYVLNLAVCENAYLSDNKNYSSCPRDSKFNSPSSNKIEFDATEISKENTNLPQKNDYNSQIENADTEEQNKGFESLQENKYSSDNELNDTRGSNDGYDATPHNQWLPYSSTKNTWTTPHILVDVEGPESDENLPLLGYLFESPKSLNNFDYSLADGENINIKIHPDLDAINNNQRNSNNI
ncbi:MAG: hypothetical protein JWM09_682 [Francisellaceae bacterium]|nr:hypothetical protein [Francisellaceae bacterium]